MTIEDFLQSLVVQVPNLAGLLIALYFANQLNIRLVAMNEKLQQSYTDLAKDLAELKAVVDMQVENVKEE